jgi:hypothetical protein
MAGRQSASLGEGIDFSLSLRLSFMWLSEVLPRSLAPKGYEFPISGWFASQ